jgi:hypothetical protein
MAQRSEDGVGKTSGMSRRLERALAGWTRSAISIQASSRDDGCINRPDTRKHLNLREQISRTPPCIQRGVHTRPFSAFHAAPNFGHLFMWSSVRQQQPSPPLRTAIDSIPVRSTYATWTRVKAFHRSWNTHGRGPPMGITTLTPSREPISPGPFGE